MERIYMVSKKELLERILFLESDIDILMDEVDKLSKQLKPVKSTTKKVKSKK